MQVQIVLLLTLLVLSSAFIPSMRSSHSSKSKTSIQMVEITKGVEFDTVAREWRFKWSPDDDKASLASAQTTLKIFESEIKAIPGVKCCSEINVQACKFI